jgi:hypothetical protein
MHAWQRQGTERERLISGFVHFFIYVHTSSAVKKGSALHCIALHWMQQPRASKIQQLASPFLSSESFASAVAAIDRQGKGRLA